MYIFKKEIINDIIYDTDPAPTTTNPDPMTKDPDPTTTDPTTTDPTTTDPTSTDPSTNRCNDDPDATTTDLDATPILLYYVLNVAVEVQKD